MAELVADSAYENTLAMTLHEAIDDFLWDYNMNKLKSCFLLMMFSIAGSCHAGVLLTEDVSLTVDGVDILPEFFFGTVPPNVDLSTFNETFNSNGLGSFRVDLNGVGTHSVIAFFNHQIGDEEFGEFGEVFGSADSRQSWEVDEPFPDFFDPTVGDIFDNFLDNSLDEINTVAKPTNSSPQPIFDVSMAMAWNFSLSAGQTATVEFEVSGTEPTSPFFLRQFDEDEGQSIYLSSSLTISGPPTNVIPEPASLLVWAPCLGLIAIRRRRIHRS